MPGSTGPAPYAENSFQPPTPLQLRYFLRKHGSGKTIAVLRRFQKEAPAEPIYDAVFGLALRDAIEQARTLGVSLLCLPELSVTGYGCEDAFFSPAVQDMARTLLGEIVPHTSGMAVSIGLPLMYAGALYNASLLVRVLPPAPWRHCRPDPSQLDRRLDHQRRSQLPRPSVPPLIAP